MFVKLLLRIFFWFLLFILCFVDILIIYTFVIFLIGSKIHFYVYGMNFCVKCLNTQLVHLKKKPRLSTPTKTVAEKLQA